LALRRLLLSDEGAPEIEDWGWSEAEPQGRVNS